MLSLLLMFDTLSIRNAFPLSHHLLGRAFLFTQFCCCPSEHDTHDVEADSSYCSQDQDRGWNGVLELLENDRDHASNHRQTERNSDAVAFGIFGGHSADLRSNGSATEHHKDAPELDASLRTEGESSVQTGDHYLKQVSSHRDVCRTTDEVDKSRHSEQAAANSQETGQHTGQEADKDGKPHGTRDPRGLEVHHGRDTYLLERLVPGEPLGSALAHFAPPLFLHSFAIVGEYHKCNQGEHHHVYPADYRPDLADSLEPHDHLSAACLEMVESVASGVMYSRDPKDLMHDHVLISAVWGLGPYAVDGIVTPDSYVVSKEDDHRIVEKNTSRKPVRLEANPAGGLREVPVEKEFQDRPCLSDYQIRTLASYGKRIEDHYNFPQDMEWALARDGRLLILQTRPLHLEEFAQKGRQQVPKIEGYTVLCEGGAVACPGVGCGTAFHVENESDLMDFPEGGVLVAKHSSPQFVIVMRKAQAIVAEAGSITGHMASLSREFGLPTVLAMNSATKLVPSGIEITVDAYSGRVYQGRVRELIALQRSQESPMKNTPVYETLRRVADWIVPLDLVNPTAPNFTPENCKTLHDVMRYVHEFSYREMFQISDLLSDTSGGGALRLVGPIPLDLHVIDLGGGLTEGTRKARRVNVDEVLSVPFQALLKGILHVGAQVNGPRPVDLGGFLSVMREQMLSPATMAERFGDRSYAIISDCYLNFSSRIGYHYSALDSFCSEFVNKNYITFSFKGGAADDVRRQRRARSIASVLRALEFSVEVREDRVDARYYRYEQELIEEKLDALGRLLQFTRQMDMLMASEASVDALATSFLKGNYSLDQSLFESLQSGRTETEHGSKRKPNPDKDAESSV